MRNCNFPKLANQAAVLAGLLAVTAFLACSGQLRAQSADATGSGHTFVPSTSLVTLDRHMPAKVLDGTAARVGHYNPEQKLRLVLTIQAPRMAEEEQFIKELVTKGSPNFHKFLTLEQWNVRYAPSAEDEQAVVDWAQSVGLTVTKRYSDRLIVDVEGTAGTIEKAFGVTINNYKVGDDVDFSNDRDPVIPANLSGILRFVTGLNNVERAHRIGSRNATVKGADYVPGPVVSDIGSMHGDGDPTKAPAARRAAMTSRAAARNESGSPTKPKAGDNYPLDDMSGTYAMDPDNVQSSNGYDYNALQKLSFCCNQPGLSGGSPPESSIALVGFGGFLNTDVATFFGAYGMAYNIGGYCIGGGSCPGNDGEAPLDVEYSGAMSNSYGSYLDTARIWEYEMTNTNYSTYESTFNQIVSDGHAKVVSTSYGWEENAGFSGSVATGTMHPIFNTMVGTGITLIAASGDNGASDGCGNATAVDYPSSDPDFIAAGGTQLNMYTNGIFYSETAWQGEFSSGSCGSNHGGSTGGVSVLFAAPAWQVSTTNATYPTGVVSPYYSYQTISGVTTEWETTGNTNRMVPDIALTANPDVLGQWYVSGGSWQDEGGTSIVAPELAGFFAQENSYLDYIGDACGGSGTSACSPVGNAAPFFYYNAILGAPHNPFYDMLSGCNDNNRTVADDLFYYCAAPGYDLVTGWGSANMMQLAWGINWEIIPADGAPSLSFGGPSTYTWYNTDQIIDWDLTDGSSNGYTPPGSAGFTLGWDSIPSDSYSEPHGGDGDTFYTGPQYTYSTFGCVDNTGAFCQAASGQGCHTVYVRGWDNQGITTNGSYGPVCFDSVPPTIAIQTSPSAPAPTGWFNIATGGPTVSLVATDPGGSNASGVKTIYGVVGPTTCSPTNLGSCQIYGPPFGMPQGGTAITTFSEDNAGNFSNVLVEALYVDTVAPTTTSTLTGNLVSGTYYSNVKVTLNAADTVSGVLHTYYNLDGGSNVVYSGSPFTVSAVGGHVLIYWSVDNAGNVESGHTVILTIATPVAAVLITPTPGTTLVGPTVPFTWSAASGATDYSLWLGSTGVGSSNLYHSGATAALTKTAGGLPVNGETVYARLYTTIGTVTLFHDYTYTAAAQAVLTTPAPSTLLVGPRVTFIWTAGTGNTTGYSLWLGSAAGTDNLYHSGVVTATSVTPGGLPINGETIYARLFTYINGVTEHADYIYTASAQAVMTAPAPSTVLVGPTVTFTWTAGTGNTTGYSLWLGSTGVGSNNLYHSGAVTATSVTAGGMPTNGETVYARLFTYINGSTVHADYTYTAAAQAVLTTPAPSTVLVGPAVTFTWTAGTGNTTGYSLWLGTAVGTFNLYHSGETVATSVTAGLPTNGETVYARLFTTINGVAEHTDYTYTAAAQAVLTTPTPGSTLTGSSATFTWTAGTGNTTGYSLWLGSTGVGSNNLYHSGSTVATSVTATGLPTNGETIYARLFSYINGTAEHTDYTYTAQ